MFSLSRKFVNNDGKVVQITVTQFAEEDVVNLTVLYSHEKMHDVSQQFTMKEAGVIRNLLNGIHDLATPLDVDLM